MTSEEVRPRAIAKYVCVHRGLEIKPPAAICFYPEETLEGLCGRILRGYSVTLKGVDAARLEFWGEGAERDRQERIVDVFTTEGTTKENPIHVFVAGEHSWRDWVRSFYDIVDRRPNGSEKSA
ncbi:unnamed protein product [Vitrella brassicaformis CCMP3155]|uniref:Uncharacterized protein n=2 Tax=Vitrella brassicaformis TaxID=1169539 RepID=A0A0G4ETC8_VITBC|nr:unnamed protein product [Vitrella brassicaformis CCMP3155]|mmetsp:Transcript_2099/g.4749  ORF Transcript_2099/g.4749 Transcript_2099/m.4749 type:complete len:123 (+) Transcript_2099:303-671(+)|eukprot:CEM01497.1 unnamed protein product [Vitrella brassicaformis CCMP3155]